MLQLYPILCKFTLSLFEMCYPDLQFLRRYRLYGLVLGLGLFATVSATASEDYSEGEKLFSLKVKPLLKQKCFSCHNDEELKGDLVLTSLDDALLGGETSDEVLIPGDAENSLMYISTTWSDPDYEMPLRRRTSSPKSRPGRSVTGSMPVRLGLPRRIRPS